MSFFQEEMSTLYFSTDPVARSLQMLPAQEEPDFVLTEKIKSLYLHRLKKSCLLFNCHDCPYHYRIYSWLHRHCL